MFSRRWAVLASQSVGGDARRSGEAQLRVVVLSADCSIAANFWIGSEVRKSRVDRPSATAIRWKLASA